MKNDKTAERMASLKEEFCAIQSTADLCQLIRYPQRKMGLLVQQPRYKTFSIPKKGGGKRIIETPHSELKGVQSRINRYLQAVYYLEKSSAAYGFIVGVKNDDDRRNVLSNARKHLGNPYMLQLDFKDFFHQVTTAKVRRIFSGHPFHFRGALLDTLTTLCVYEGRLPMGTPTSPILSNFACRGVDKGLVTHARINRWAFTRYADDLTFSSDLPFGRADLHNIGRIIEDHGFAINPDKVKRFEPNDTKIVTGLLVADEVTLAPDYLENLREDIDKLKKVLLTQNEQGLISVKWTEQFKQQVRGRLSFAGFVLGRGKKEYKTLLKTYRQATNPPQDEFGAVNWRSFPYNF